MKCETGVFRGICGVGLAVAAITTAGTGASAAPGGAAAVSCQYYAGMTGSTHTGEGVNCTGTTRKYAVRVQCEDPFHGTDTWYTGPYKYSPDVSRYTCPKYGSFQGIVVGYGVVFG